MKKVYKFLLTLMIAVSAFTMNVSAASFTASSSTQTVAPGGTFTVAIGGDCVGRVDISVDNGTITSISSEGKVLSGTTAKTWIEESKPTTVTIQAGESGTVTITAVPFEGILSTPEAEPFSPGNRVVSVNIVKPEVKPEDKPEQEKPSAKPETDKPTTKPQSKPETKPEKTQTSIKGAVVSFEDNIEYTGKEIKPSVSVVLDGKELKEGKDYKVSYSNNIEVGKGTITITGIGDYKGTITKTFNITEKPKISIANAMVADIDDIEFTGSELTPSVVVTLDGKTLVEGVDYTVAYTNNVELGTATITITGIGDYEGTITKTFNIVKPAYSATCSIHWIIVIVCLVAALSMFAIGKTKQINIAIAGIGGASAIVLAITAGACGLDLPIALVGTVVLVVLALMLKKSHIQEN